LLGSNDRPATAPADDPRWLPASGISRPAQSSIASDITGLVREHVAIGRPRLQQAIAKKTDLEIAFEYQLVTGKDSAICRRCIFLRHPP
jgi:hypothetical protein